MPSAGMHDPCPSVPMPTAPALGSPTFWKHLIDKVLDFTEEESETTEKLSDLPKLTSDPVLREGYPFPCCESLPSKMQKQDS